MDQLHEDPSFVIWIHYSGKGEKTQGRGGFDCAGGWELVLRLCKDGFARIPDMDAPYERHDQYGVKVDPVAAAMAVREGILPKDVKAEQLLKVLDRNGAIIPGKPRSFEEML